MLSLCVVNAKVKYLVFFQRAHAVNNKKELCEWKKANSESEVSFIVPLMSNKSQLAFFPPMPLW